MEKQNSNAFEQTALKILFVITALACLVALALAGCVQTEKSSANPPEPLPTNTGAANRTVENATANAVLLTDGFCSTPGWSTVSVGQPFKVGNLTVRLWGVGPWVFNYSDGNSTDKPALFEAWDARNRSLGMYKLYPGENVTLRQTGDNISQVLRFHWGSWYDLAGQYAQVWGRFENCSWEYLDEGMEVRLVPKTVMERARPDLYGLSCEDYRRHLQRFSNSTDGIWTGRGESISLDNLSVRYVSYEEGRNMSVNWRSGWNHPAQVSVMGKDGHELFNLTVPEGMKAIFQDPDSRGFYELRLFTLVENFARGSGAYAEMEFEPDRREGLPAANCTAWEDGNRTTAGFEIQEFSLNQSYAPYWPADCRISGIKADRPGEKTADWVYVYNATETRFVSSADNRTYDLVYCGPGKVRIMAPKPACPFGPTWMHVGDIGSIGDWKVRLADIGPAAGEKNEHPAYLDIFDEHDVLIGQAQVMPGQNFTFARAQDSKSINIKVDFTDACLTLACKTAQVWMSPPTCPVPDPYPPAPPPDGFCPSGGWSVLSYGEEVKIKNWFVRLKFVPLNVSQTDASDQNPAVLEVFDENRQSLGTHTVSPHQNFGVGRASDGQSISIQVEKASPGILLRGWAEIYGRARNCSNQYFDAAMTMKKTG